jgi:hypothetical protein
MAADAFEDIVQVSEGIEAESLGSRDEAAEHGGGAAALAAAIEGPVATTDGDATQAALGPGMPTSGFCRAISPPMGSERDVAALIVMEAA